MDVTILLHTGLVSFTNVISCGCSKHYDGIHRPKRYLFVKSFDKEHGVVVSKEFFMSRVSEYWCDSTI